MGVLPIPTKRMLNKAEAANYCGFETGSAFAAAVPVPPVQIGSKMLYDQKALDAWLDQLSTPTERKRGFAERVSRAG